MEEIQSLSILNDASEKDLIETTSTTDNLLTLALKALRLENTKVSYNKTSKSGKYDNLVEISLQEVAEHDNIEDCWVAIYDRVYDVTKFLATHPGGWDVILDYAGMDCTIAFRGTGHSKEAIDMLDKYLIGRLPTHQLIFRRQNGGIRFSDMPE